MSIIRKKKYKILNIHNSHQKYEIEQRKASLVHFRMFLIYWKQKHQRLSQAISQLTLYKYSLSARVAVYRIPNGGKNS